MGIAIEYHHCHLVSAGSLQHPSKGDAWWIWNGKPLLKEYRAMGFKLKGKMARTVKSTLPASLEPGCSEKMASLTPTEPMFWHSL